MRKHITRIASGVTFVVAVVDGALDMDLSQVDKNFVFISKTTFGVKNPPAHFVSNAWSHPGDFSGSAPTS